MTLAEDISLLTRVPLFADLASDHLRLLAFSTVRLELPAGRVLFEAGDPAQSGYVVMSGEIALLRREEGETKVLGRFGPGSLLGETALFVETRRPATATATIGTSMAEIDRALMRRMLTEYPEVAARMHSRLLERFGTTLQELGRVGERLDGIAFPERDG